MCKSRCTATAASPLPSLKAPATVWRRPAPKPMGFKTGAVRPTVPGTMGPKPIKQPAFGEPKTHHQFLSLGVPKNGRY